MEKAQKGDLIRVVAVNDSDFIGTAYAVGEILEVSERRLKGNGDDENDFVITTGDCRLYDNEYVIHRKAGEEDSEQDAVNSPTHYTQGKFETIEIIEHLTAKYDDGFTAHCVGTAFKYMDRAPYKHESPTECLRKAAKYLEFAIKRLDAKSTQNKTE